MSWVRHLLLLLVAHTISSNKTDRSLNLIDYYEKNKEVSPLEILLQDDKFLRKNAQKHGYINREWSGMLADSTTTTPCSKNPRLNNPDCIKNKKHSYFSSVDESTNTEKYEDNYSYVGPRVGPALANTERYILGKRTNENFRLDTTDDRNIVANESETETTPAKKGDDKQHQTGHQVTTTESPNTLENYDIDYLNTEQNTSLHEVQPDDQLTQKEPTQLENGQPNNSSSCQKSPQSINSSFRNSFPHENQTTQALLHGVNEKLPGQNSQTSERNSQSQTTPELHENASFAGKGRTRNNQSKSSEDLYPSISSEPLTPGTIANRNLENLGNVSSEHDSISGSSGRVLENTDLEETEEGTQMENKINGEPTDSKHVNVTSIPGNSAHPYGHVDNSSLNDRHSSNTFTDQLKGTNKKLVNETSTHSNRSEPHELTTGSHNNANSSFAVKLKQMPTESTHTDADRYGGVDSASQPTSDELKEVGPHGRVDSFNASSNTFNRNDNMVSTTEQPQYETSKSKTNYSYDADNKSVKDLTHPSSVNGVFDGAVESRHNKTPEFKKSVLRGETPQTNVQSEVGPYGFVEPTSVGAQNITSFIPTNNGSSGNQQFQQEPESRETTGKTQKQNLTDAYNFPDLTIKENGVISSQLSPNNGGQVESNETLLLQKQNETVDSADVSSNYDNRKISFNPSDKKSSSDTQLYQETGLKTHSNTELGPYGLVDSASVSRNLTPEYKDTIITSSDVSEPFIQHPGQKNGSNQIPQSISVPQQNTSRNETSNQTKDSLQTDENVGPDGFDVETPKSERAPNSEDKLFQGEVNPTVAEPTFKILHHARVGNYSSTQPKMKENITPKTTEVISENSKDIFPSHDKKHSTSMIKNNASETEKAGGQFTPDSPVIPNNYTNDSGAPLNRSLLILECPVQLCYCDSGKPVKGFKLIPF